MSASSVNRVAIDPKRVAKLYEGGMSLSRLRERFRCSDVTMRRAVIAGGAKIEIGRQRYDPWAEQ